MVAAVVDHAETKLSSVAAMGLIFLDDSSIHIVLIECHLVFVAFQIDSVDLGVVVSQTCRPIKVRYAEEGPLHTAHKAELVTLDEVIAALEVFDACVRVEGTGLEAVEAEELVFLGVEIGHIEEELGVFYDIRHVAIEAEHT